MKLTIIRHGETEENRSGIIQGHMQGKLTEKGVEQAEKLGERLKNERFHAIYCSDLDRARHTAEPILIHHKNVPVRYLELFRERNLGEFEGKSKAEIGWDSDDQNQDFNQPQHGESMEELFERASRVIRLLVSAHPDDSVLLVTHGALGRALIAELEQKGLKGYNSLPGLQNSAVSIYEIEENGNSKRIILNSVQHLEL